MSTQWHPDWQLAAKVAEPTRITTYVYNGQPDPFQGGAVTFCAPADALLPDGKPIATLCKKVEQATTDINGVAGFDATAKAGVALREWKWTYNRFGQVLNAQGPRTDVNDMTTYTYYTDSTAEHFIGDLRSVTNAAGHVMQFTRYNQHGQVTQMIDENSVTVDYSYDLRLRPTSVEMGGEKIIYEYEATGSVRRITLPDGSYIKYAYDDAHRLTDIEDSVGNSIHYTLDAMGNRIKEEVKDSRGVLARQTARVYDALNRLQQITGAAQ